MEAEGNQRIRNSFHGNDGPLHVEDQRHDHELSLAFVESAVANGMKRTDDFNGAEQEGADAVGRRLGHAVRMHSP